MYVVCSMYVCGWTQWFCKIDHCIHIDWCIVMGLGHNDPWVESHMWPQQIWGQRSSRGQWPLVQVFGKKGQCMHILWCIFKSNITMIAKVCDRESRQDSWFENRLVFFFFFFFFNLGSFVSDENPPIAIPNFMKKHLWRQAHIRMSMWEPPTCTNHLFWPLVNFSYSQKHTRCLFDLWVSVFELSLALSLALTMPVSILLFSVRFQVDSTSVWSHSYCMWDLLY